MDAYRQIEVKMAEKYGSISNGTRKAIGDFLLKNDEKSPVNVKSNNVDKKNYSPNIISAKKLIKWLEKEGHKLFFIFVDYKKVDNEIVVIKESGLIPVEHISWNCLTIESQGWGVIQMNKKLEVNENQTKKEFLRGLKIAYECYMDKEFNKMKKIRDMIKDF
ncbi:hypothetical protein PP178_00715 [Zeaxanthinibacter sp. PT1]|uniref:hypothetical protein n=1 Tax=Zeaxanthinibacter TaxID=561554 RepID=UPI00234AD047|nr:hypothetical protein [Zeaxanthinibacter sp. PT1]MDC6350058.1 hypothetical protein [Zeaxanthinibacter sp. PT1]